MTETTPTFWEDRWRAVIEASPLRKRRNPNGDGMRRWNKMAAGFAERTADQASKEKRRATLEWLRDLGALTPDARVLDIGAGPGNWSLLLARHGTHVTALEPADAMADILQNRMEAEGITHITIDRRTWQSIDPVKEQWERAFDLVFASMTPGIDGPANLYKMIAVSRGHCYLSAFSGRGWRQWYGDLWRAVFNEPLNGHPDDIIHPFNLIYAMGHRPELRFNFWRRETPLSWDEAMEDFLAHLEGFTEMTDTVQAAVAAYVDQHCRDGVLIHQRDGCQGVMVWDVNQRIDENE